MSCTQRKKPSALAGILLALLLVTPAVSGADPFEEFGVVRPRERLEAPAFQLLDLDGQERALAEFQGQIILVHFWATWCRPCRKEVPTLEKLQKRLADRDVTVLAISADRGSKKRVARKVKDWGIHSLVLLDPSGEVRREYEVAGLPFTYIVGRDGKFLGKVIGDRDWSSEEARAFFDELLKDEPAP